METLFIAALIGLIPAMIAQSKGKSFAAWWLYGAALFIIALPHALIMSADKKVIEEKQLSDGMKKCPYCAELIKEEAVICRYCGKDQPSKAKDPAKKDQFTFDASPVNRTQPIQPSYTKKCPECGEIMPIAAKNCSKCSHAFEMAPRPLRCNECGQDISHMPDKCPKCWKKYKYKTQ